MLVCVCVSVHVLVCVYVSVRVLVCVCWEQAGASNRNMSMQLVLLQTVFKGKVLDGGGRQAYKPPELNS